MALSSSKAHRAVVAPERDDETHLSVRGAAGIARQRADAFEGAGLVRAALALEQVWRGREQVEHLGKAAGREAVAAAEPDPSSSWIASARPFAASILRSRPHRLLQADRTAHAVRADLQKNLVGDVVVRAMRGARRRISERVRDWR